MHIRVFYGNGVTLSFTSIQIFQNILKWVLQNLIRKSNKYFFRTTSIMLFVAGSVPQLYHTKLPVSRVVVSTFPEQCIWQRDLNSCATSKKRTCSARGTSTVQQWWGGMLQTILNLKDIVSRSTLYFMSRYTRPLQNLNENKDIINYSMYN